MANTAIHSRLSNQGWFYGNSKHSGNLDLLEDDLDYYPARMLRTQCIVAGGSAMLPHGKEMLPHSVCAPIAVQSITKL